VKKNIPEKGAVLQRDGETYAIKVHMPGGYTTPQELRTVADVAERHGIPTVKVTIAQRIALIGVPEEKIDAVRADLGELEDGATGLCIRYVKMCPGATWCKRGHKATHDIGMAMDQRFHRLQVPWKFKMAVSGCVNDCTEVCIRDLGLIGTAAGWNVMIGGNGGSRPRFSVLLVENVPTENEALAVLDKVVDWCKSLERKCRIGKVVEELGVEAVRKQIFGQ